MSPQLTQQEAHNALLFLNRVDLKGSEAEPMAMLKMKLAQIANPQQQQPEREIEKGRGFDEAESGNVTDLQGHKGEGAA